MYFMITFKLVLRRKFISRERKRKKKRSLYPLKNILIYIIDEALSLKNTLNPSAHAYICISVPGFEHIRTRLLS